MLFGMLYFHLFRADWNEWLGGLAQLGERLTGSQEVSGSIPLISTTKNLETVWFQGFFMSMANCTKLFSC